MAKPNMTQFHFSIDNQDIIKLMTPWDNMGAIASTTIGNAKIAAPTNKCHNR